MLKKQPELERTLTGRFGVHQRYLVAKMLAPTEALTSLQLVQRQRPPDVRVNQALNLPP